MKNILLLLIISIVLSCTSESDTFTTDLSKYFSGNHELRKFNKGEKSTAASWSASYFLFFGSASGRGEQKEAFIGFSWKNNNGEYVYSQVPLDKVRIKFDNKSEVPYITFGFDKQTDTYMNPDMEVSYLMEYKINYVVVHCREEDYPSEVNINSLK